MKSKRWLKRLSVGLFVFLMASTLAAADQTTTISLGAGAGIGPDYEGSEDYEAMPLAFARVDWSNGIYVEVPGYGLTGNLIPNSAWKAGPIVQYNGGRDDVENDAVDALRDVDESLEIGGFVGLDFNNWGIQVEGVQDVLDGHDGFLITFGIGYSQPLHERVELSLDFSTTYASQDYMDAYFSVDANNAVRSGLDTFDADAGVKDFGVELALSYSPWESWNLTTIASYTRLLGDAADSPIVDDEGNANQYSGGIIVSYSF